MSDASPTLYRDSESRSSSALDSVEVFALSSSPSSAAGRPRPLATRSFAERLFNLSGYAWRVIQDRQSPSIYFLLGICTLLILTSPLRWAISLALCCFALGYAFASPSVPCHPHYLKTFLPLFAAAASSQAQGPRPAQTVGTSSMGLSSAVETKVALIVDYFIRDFVDYWYGPLNKSGRREFQSAVRASLLAAIGSFLALTRASSRSAEPVDLMSLILYGLTNATVLHMKEFRQFESASPHYTSLEAFVEGHSASPYWKGFLTSREAELQYLHDIAALLLSRLLPAEDAASRPLFSLLKELIVSQFLWPLLDRFGEPDTLNSLLLRWLKTRDSPADEDGHAMSMKLKITQIQNMPFLCSSEFYLVFGIGSVRKKTRLMNLYSSNNKTEPLFFHSLKLGPAVAISIWLMAYHHLSKDRCVAQSRFSLGTAELLASIKEYSIAMRLRNSEEPVLVVIQLTTRQVGTPSETLAEATAASGPLGNEPSNSQATTTPTVSSLSAVQRLQTAELTLDTVLESNDLFADFYEYVNESGAPPFLQFWMNADSFRRFVTMELSGSMDLATASCVGAKSAESGGHALDRDQMFMIRRDALDVYACHFGPSAKLYIPMDDAILQELRAGLEPQIDPFKWPSRPDYSIGPNVFIKAQKHVYDLLRAQYFPPYLELLQSGGRARSRCPEAGLGWQRARAWVPHLNLSSCSPGQGRHDSQPQWLGKPKERKSGFPFYYQLEVTAEEPTVQHREERDGAACAPAPTYATKPPLPPLPVAEQSTEEEINYESLTVQLEKMEDEEATDKAREKDEFSIFDFQFQPLTLSSRAKSEAVEPIFFSVSYMAQPSSDYRCLLRSYEDFKALHQSLVDLFPSLSFPEPKGVGDWEATLSTRLEIFLTRVLSDEKMACRAAVKEFFKADLQPNQVHAGLQASLQATTTEEASAKSTLFRAFKRVPGLLRAISRNPVGDALAQPLSAADPRSSLTRSATMADDSNSDRNRDTEGAKSPAVNAAASRSSSPLQPGAEAQSKAADGPKSLHRGSEPNEAEMSLLLETFFGLIEEAFDLHDKNRWLRRKIFSVFKQLVVQAYGQNIYRLLKGQLQRLTSEDCVCKLLDALLASLWPNGEWAGTESPSNCAHEEESALADNIIGGSESSLRRSDAARAAWLAQSPELLEHLLGRYHTIHGMKRIFEMTQYKTLNKRLLFIFLDVLVKLVFAATGHEAEPEK